MATRSFLRITVAAVATAVLSTQAFAQGAACTGQGRISKQIAIPMDAASKAQAAKKWRDVLARTKEAEAVAFARTAWDQYWIHEYNAYAQFNLGQKAEAAREWEANLSSPCQAEADRAKVYKRVATLYAEQRNYPKAIDLANRGLAGGRDPELMVTLGQAYFQSGDNKNALRVMKDVVASLEQRGQTPREQTLILVLNACDRMNDSTCTTQMYEKLVQHYPKPDYWENLLSKLVKADVADEVKINILRLALDVDVMKQGDHFREMAQIALDQGLPAEAETVIRKATAANVYKDQRNIDLAARLLKTAQAGVALDKPGLPKRETDARAAESGDLLVKLGASYLSYGNNEKAIEVLKQGLAKPKTTLTDDGGMLLGIAYLRSKNKVEAAKAFRSVKKDQTMARVAKLWLLNT